MKLQSHILQLTGGGYLAYSEYGDASGTPVLFCHGWPSSRTMAELTDAAARELGVRIISPDRPGISASAFVANRKLIDWPAIARELFDALGMPEVRILAIC